MRHEQYYGVFQNLYNYLKAQQNLSQSRIVIAGDLLHSKNNLSPQVVNLVVSFLNNLASLCKVYVLLGNHDINANNTNRVDAISPIISAINNDNIYLSTTTQTVIDQNIQITLIHLLQQIKQQILLPKNNDRIKIACIHQTVNGVSDYANFVYNSSRFTVQSFNNFDAVLAGHIHKPQQLINRKPYIVYPGSLIQQNFGQDNIHGLVKWNLQNDVNWQFVKIHNDYGYYSIQIVDGKLQPVTFDNNRLRLKINSINTSFNQLKDIISQINKTNIIERYSINNVKLQKSDIAKKQNQLNNIYNTQYQNKLIQQFLRFKYFDITQTQVQSIKDINLQLNSTTIFQDKQLGSVWFPKKLQFSNMFAYGPDNQINFQNWNGVIGIFGQNYSGKSSLLDILLFCLYDKTNKSSKGVDIMNSKSTQFNCKLTLDIDGNQYIIQRNGKKQIKQNTVSVTVDFYTITEDGSRLSLNGSQRSDTNKQICKYIGSYNSFQNTLGIFQKTNTGLIFQKQAQRKSFLSSLLGIDIFEKLHSQATQQIKQTKILLKQYQNRFPKQQIQNNILRVDTINSQNIDIQLKIQQLTKQLKKYQQAVILLSTKIIQISNIDTNIQKLQGNKLQKQIAIQQLQSNISTINIQMIYEQIKQIQTGIVGIDIDQLKSTNMQLVQLIQTAKSIKHKADLVQKDIALCNTKLANLKDLEYDPNCQYCMNNIFVKDAIQSKDKLAKFSEQKRLYVQQLKQTMLKVKQLQYVKQQIVQYNEKIKSKSSKYQKIALQQKKRSKYVEQLDLRKKQLLNIESKILQYNTNSNNIINNNAIQDKIKLLNIKVKQKQTQLNQYTAKQSKNNINKGMLLQKNKQLQLQIVKINQLQTQFNLYNKYLEAVNKNGIPLRLIQMSIPLIQSQTNNILSMLTQFTLQFKINQNNIDITRVYSLDDKLPVQLGSGFEQTVSDVASRIALSKISNAPRSNIVIIDQNFSALDSNNIMKVQQVLQYLKQSYQYVLIISHIDILKSMVDDSITIVKDNQFSHIQ